MLISKASPKQVKSKLFSIEYTTSQWNGSFWEIHDKIYKPHQVERCDKRHKLCRQSIGS